MDVLLDSLPFRPLLSRHHHHHHRQPPHTPHAQRTASASSSSSTDRWTESIDLLRVSLPPTNDPSSSSSPPPLHPPTPSSPTNQEDSSSTMGPFEHLRPAEPKTVAGAPTDPAALALGGAGLDDAGAPDGDPPTDPSCKTCRQQQQREGRQTEGVYYYYHHRPFCRACHESSNPTDQSPVYFNYLKLPGDPPPPPPPSRPTPRVPPPAPARSPYSALGGATGGGAQRPYTRVKTDPGARVGGAEAPGDRPIAAECRLLAARRRLFRLPSPFLFRFSGGCPTSRPKTSGSGSGSLDSSLVEGKADDECDGKTGNGNGKVASTKSRGTRDRKCRRYKNHRVVVVAIFLFSLFIAAAAAVLGIVLLWSPIHSAASSSLATDLGRNPSPKADHVTIGSDVQYITVTGSLEKATPDSSGWTLYSRGSPRGSKYTIVNKPLTFYSAQEHCQRLGGYLVHINTLREQLFIEDFLTQELDRLGSAEDSSGGIGFWIGAKRARGSHDGTCMFEQWKWVDSYGRSLGPIAGLTAFIPGKPDNQYNPEECLFISTKERSDENRFLKWDDAPCDLNSIGTIKAVCEVEIR